MTKHQIARWLTPGRTQVRLVFATYGGSAHGKVDLEVKDAEDGWINVDHLTQANGIPKAEHKEISSETINQFTGERS